MHKHCSQMALVRCGRMDCFLQQTSRSTRVDKKRSEVVLLPRSSSWPVRTIPRTFATGLHLDGQTLVLGRTQRGPQTCGSHLQMLADSDAILQESPTAIDNLGSTLDTQDLGVPGKVCFTTLTYFGICQIHLPSTLTLLCND